MKEILYSFGFLVVVATCVTSIAGEAAGVCNGTTTETSGTLQFAGNKDSICTYTFAPTEGFSQIAFMITESNLDNDAWVAFYNGAASLDKLVANLTHASWQTVVIVVDKDSTILFFGGTEATPGDFSVTFDTAPKNCVRKYADVTEQTTIEGPLYPAGSPVDCSISISLSGATQRAALTFTDVKLTKGEVAVYESTAEKTLLSHFTESTIPGDAISTGAMYVMIVYGAVKDAKEIQTLAGLVYLVSASSMQKNITKTDYVTSFGFPSEYPNNEEMVALVQSEAGTTMRVKFEGEVDLADTYDTIRLMDGPSKLSRPLAVINKGMEDRVSTVTWLTSSDSVYIQFKTDEILTAKGFNLSVTQQKLGGALVSTGGATTTVLLQTDNTTTQSPDDVVLFQCIVEEGQQVALKVVDFTAQKQTYASSISFYDGLSDQDPLIGYFTTDHEYYPVVSNRHELLIKAEGYFSNMTSVGPQLFNATFAPQDKNVLYKTSAGESDTFNLDAGSSVSEAVWAIHKTEERHHISLRINRYLLEDNATIAIFDHLSDRSNDSLVTLKAMNSANRETLPPIHLEQARVVYSINNKAADAGKNNLLQASYEIHPICERNISVKTDSFGFLTTPDFPNRHPLNLQCAWIFPGVANTTVRILFEDFQLFSPSYIEIIDANHSSTSDNTTVVKASGEGLPDDYIWKGVEGRDVIVYFKSDLESLPGQDIYNSGRGLSMKFENLTDGGNITSGSPVQNPKYPKPETENITAVWVISVPEFNKGDNNSINILKYTITAQEEGNTVLEIRDGGAARSAALVKPTFKGGKAENLLSRTNKLWVKYEFMKNGTNDTHTGFPFQLTYSTYKCTTLCKNGICLHDDWKCNGQDDCGDGTDEADCTCGPSSKIGVSYALLGGAIVATLIVTLLIALGGPILYRKWKTRGGYSDLNEPVNPTA